MALTRIVGAGYGIGDEIASSDLTDIDANIENALDKRTGQTDTLLSIVTEDGGGRVILEVTAGADADTTYTRANGGCFAVPSLSADRIYTFSNTGAAAGDRIVVWGSAGGMYGVTVKDHGGANVLGVIHPTLVASSNEGPIIYLQHNGTDWKNVKPFHAVFQETFTANGTFTFPTGVYTVGYEMFGGGGGGAGGCSASTTTSVYKTGGGGGGGSKTVTGYLAGTPGGTAAVVVGAGGSGGGAATNGSDGANSSLGAKVALGGGGGRTDTGSQNWTGTDVVSTLGGKRRGAPRAMLLNSLSSNNLVRCTTSTVDTIAYMMDDGEGGFGGVAAALLTGVPSGGPSLENYVGGNGGALGTTSGSYLLGYPGGGGGAGPAGNGTNGGAGGSGNNAGAGTNGGTASNASANTGAGGGGGGGGGHGSASGGTGGTGGTGGSGKVIVTYWK